MNISLKERDLGFIARTVLQNKKQENIMQEQNTGDKVAKYVVSTSRPNRTNVVISCSEKDVESVARSMGGKLLYKLK